MTSMLASRSIPIHVQQTVVVPGGHSQSEAYAHATTARVLFCPLLISTKGKGLNHGF